MTKACCENIKAILEGAGSSISKIVKVTTPLAPFPFRCPNSTHVTNKPTSRSTSS